ncbi:MAG: glycosyltransferase [Paludibacter sp.]
MFVPTSEGSKKISISLVVACKNEEVHLQRLLSCLAQQSFQNFELILVNDHSTDGTSRIMQKAVSAFSNLQILNSTGFGKKQAIKDAIILANGKIIVTTDADCTPSFHWLETIVSFYKKYPSDLIICPVRLSNSGSLFSHLQSLEFTSLVASGGAAAGAGMPILCNGANLAFTKKAWLQSQNDLHLEEPSGDDIFLLQSIKKRRGVIRFLKSESAFVTTKATNTLGEFYRQRQRWAAKSPSYTDWQLIITACIVLSISLLVLLLFGLSIYDPSYWKVLIATTTVKFLIDASFLFSVRTFFQLQYVWWYAFLLSMIYPFYIVFIALSALLFKPKNWK